MMASVCKIWPTTSLHDRHSPGLESRMLRKQPVRFGKGRLASSDPGGLAAYFIVAPGSPGRLDLEGADRALRQLSQASQPLLAATVARGGLPAVCRVCPLPAQPGQ